MSTKTNKAIVRRHIEQVWNEFRLDLYAVGVKAEPSGHDRDHAEPGAPFQNGLRLSLQPDKCPVDGLVVRSDEVEEVAPIVEPIPEVTGLDPKVLQAGQNRNGRLVIHGWLAGLGQALIFGLRPVAGFARIQPCAVGG